MRLFQRLREEPHALFGHIGPVIERTVGGIVACCFGKRLHRLEALNQARIVITQLFDHLFCSQRGIVLILDLRIAGNRTETGERVAIQFSNPLANHINLVTNFNRMLIEQQMQIAETRPGDMPMEILSL